MTDPHLTLYTETNTILHELQQLFTCTLCHQIYSRPATLLSCNHIFCADCIEQHEDAATTVGAVCPVPRCNIDYYVRDKRANNGLVSIISSFLPLLQYVQQNKLPDLDSANSCTAATTQQHAACSSPHKSANKPCTVAEHEHNTAQPVHNALSDITTTVAAHPTHKRKRVDAKQYSNSMIESESQLEQLIVPAEPPAQCVAVCFTGTSNVQHAQYTEICNKLQIQHTSKITDATTHLVCSTVQPDSRVTNRTVKYCEALLRGLHIVTPAWLHECSTRHCIVDSAPYLIISDSTSDRTSATPTNASQRSLHSTPEQRQLLSGMHFCLLPVYGERDPPVNEVQRLLQLAGATIVPTLPSIAALYSDVASAVPVGCDSNVEYNDVVLLAPSNTKPSIANSVLLKTIQTAQMHHVQCVSVVWLLQSICAFKALPTDRHRYCIEKYATQPARIECKVSTVTQRTV